MAKFGFDYQVDVENTENQGGDFGLLPEMYARLEVSACDLKPTKDTRGTEAALVIDVIEPEEFKGRKIWAYWTIDHPDGKVINKAFGYGKAQFDRLCRAVGVPFPEDTDDILLRAFVAKVGVKAGGPKDGGGFYKDKNEIKHWYYDDDDAKEPIPEIGVIEGAAPAAANDNRPAANDNRPAAKPAPARAAGSKPWANKK